MSAAQLKPLFLGREREVQALRDAFEEAVAGRGSLFLISGAPGVGKTKLAEAACDHARQLGAALLWGRCWENGGAPPYWPWVQALRGYARERDPDELASEACLTAPYLARLVPEIAAACSVGAQADAASAESEQARFALFQAVGDFLRAAGAKHPLVLVLDDLHAADPSSLLMLRFIARGLRDVRLLAIGTYRDLEARLDPEIHALLRDIERDSAELSLGGLGDSEVGRIVSARTGMPASPELIASLQDTTEGNPFFLDELLRLLQAERGLEIRLGAGIPATGGGQGDPLAPSRLSA